MFGEAYLKNKCAALFALWFCYLSLPLLPAQQKLTADLVIVGGPVITMDRAQPIAEALAIRGHQILAVGDSDQVRNWIGPDTQVIKLESGQTVVPGLIEGHGHFLGLGDSLMSLNLMEAKTWDEIVAQVEAAAKITPAGQWIVGRGWHQSKWDQIPEPNIQGYPTSDSLSKISPNHPVLLVHASGHMSMANAYAMQQAGVDRDTAEPAGGEILKDTSGQATGVFRETAQQLIQRVYARDQQRLSAEERLSKTTRAIQLAGAECVRYGITSFQDAGTSFGQLRVLKQFAASGQLPVRLWVMIRDDMAAIEQQLAAAKLIGYADHFLTVRAIKLSIDGALGPHGAWLLAPYADLPTSMGLNTADLSVAARLAELANTHDFQLCVHAIGDRANREVLDIFERTFSANPRAVPRRWRIEHAQHLHPDDIPRFGKLGVIAAMQGVHCTSDAIFVPQRLGMLRSENGAYMWRSLIDTGAIVTNGTDAPVESIDPFASLYASVTRKLKNGDTFFPQQVMTREEALRSYTIDNAYAGFEESIKGSLVPGKLADFIILDRDLMNCPAEEILTTKVLKTFIGGRLVYEAKQ